MKLHELELLVTRLKQMDPVPDTILFTDYSRRSYPYLDIEKPVAKICMGDHLTIDGVFHVPLDSVPTEEV